MLFPQTATGRQSIHRHHLFARERRDHRDFGRRFPSRLRADHRHSRSLGGRRHPSGDIHRGRQQHALGSVRTVPNKRG